MATPPVDWDHVYLLAWYDRDRQGYLTTWDGDLPYIHVVITGLSDGHAHRHGMPLWKAPVPPGAELVQVPEGRDPHEYAAELGGFYAMGWHMPTKIEREWPKPFPECLGT